MAPSPFRDPSALPCLDPLLDTHADILEELLSLDETDFPLAPDSLGDRPGPYDERGWLWYGLCGEGAPEAHRSACPRTAAACERLPGLVNAGFSRLLPGTHLEPHRGELQGVLRCHLGLEVPEGDLGLRFGDQTRSWRPGELLLFDDTLTHEAWNHALEPRTVLLVTLRADLP